MTDQQSVWTISGYHKSLSASPRSYASASDAASGAAPPLRTPHLDRLMARGVAFTSFVASAPWCVPSRGCLMTARHPVHHGAHLGSDTGFNLRRGVPTMGDGFAAAGYATAYLGKWHLGGNERGGGARRRGRNLDGHNDVTGATLVPGTGGFADTRYMWNAGHFKTIVDCEEDAEAEGGGAGGGDAGGRGSSWCGEGAPPIFALDVPTDTCSTERVRWLDGAAWPLRVSWDVPCSRPERHYTTNALTRFAIRTIAQHMGEGGGGWARRPPLFLVLSIPDPHPYYQTRRPYNTMHAAHVTVPRTIDDADAAVNAPKHHLASNPQAREDLLRTRQWYMGMVRRAPSPQPLPLCVLLCLCSHTEPAPCPHVPLFARPYAHPASLCLYCA